MTYIGADSKLYNTPSFTACLGTTITAEDIDKFNDVYDDTINEMLTALDVKKKRTCYKSYDFAQLYKANLIDGLESFILKVLDSKVCSCVVHNTTFNISRTPEIILFNSSHRVKTLDFMKKYLSQYYNYISAWNTIKINDIKDANIWLDSFTGQYTNAWNELSSDNSITVFYDGDQCNRLISLSDLFVRYIDECSRNRQFKIHDREIKDKMIELGIDKHCDSKYVGDLKNIVPKNRHYIDLNNLYSKPTIYILKEGIMIDEKKWIENSPELMDKIYEFACVNKSGVKFIDYHQDNSKIREGDYLVYLGEEGKKQANFLIDLGYKIKALFIKDI